MTKFGKINSVFLVAFLGWGIYTPPEESPTPSRERKTLSGPQLFKEDLAGQFACEFERVFHGGDIEGYTSPVKCLLALDSRSKPYEVILELEDGTILRGWARETEKKFIFRNNFKVVSEDVLRILRSGTRPRIQR